MLGRLLERRDRAPRESRSWSLSQLGGLAGYYIDAYGYSQPMTLERALSFSAVAACADVLATSMSTLPLDVVRPKGNVRLPVTPTPPLIANPSGLVAPDVWLYQLGDGLVTDGNAFGLVTATTGGRWPAMVEWVDPATVTERRVVDGVLEVKIAGKVQRRYPTGDLVHVPGKRVRGGSPFAVSPLAHATEVIAGALAARRFSNDFFAGGGHPTSILTSDEDVSEEEAKDAKAAFVRATMGREPAALGGAWKHQQVQSTPDVLTIDLQRFAIEEACRFFGVPPSMVFAAVSGQSVTYANVSQNDLQFLKRTLEVYLLRIEGALTGLLPKPQKVKVNRSALLRSDAETRWKVHDLRLRNRTTTVNDVRALEDEQPFDDEAFDVPGIPPMTNPAPAGDGGDPSEEGTP